jgi:hypothetical protein
LAIASYAGKGTGEKSLFRRLYDTLKPGDVVLADALFDDYFIACDLHNRGIDLVVHTQFERKGTRLAESRADGDVVVWQRPQKPLRMTGEQYRSYPEQLLMREVTVDARDKNNRVQQFKVVTTILTPSIDGRQIGALYVHRWAGEVDIRSIKCTMQTDILRRKTPDLVHKGMSRTTMRWSHTAATPSCAANGQTDRPKLKLVPFVTPTSKTAVNLSNPQKQKPFGARPSPIPGFAGAARCGTLGVLGQRIS